MSGGVFYIENSCPTIMNGITFLQNEAIEDGGIFYIYSQIPAATLANPLFDIQISTSSFTNAYAANDGGGFYIESPLMRNIQITDSNFINMKSA